MTSIPGVTEAASALSRTASKGASQAAGGAAKGAAKTAGGAAKSAGSTASSTTQRMGADARKKIVDKTKESLKKRKSGAGAPAADFDPADNSPLDGGGKVAGSSGAVKNSTGMRGLDELKSRKQDSKQTEKEMVEGLKKADGGGPLNKAYGVAGGVVSSTLDAGKNAEMRKRDKVEDKKMDSDRVKAFDKVGARGDADTFGGKGKRKTVRRVLDVVETSTVDPTRPMRNTKFGREATDEAKKLVPKGVRNTAGRAKRDVRRVVEETANDALDGAVEGGGIPGAVVGGLKGFGRGLMQSKTLWNLLGLSALSTAFLAAILTLIVVASTSLVNQALDDWRVQAGVKATEAAGVAKGWYNKNLETAHKVTDGAEWVVGAAVEKGAGLVDTVGGVVNGESDGEANAENSAMTTSLATSANSASPLGIPVEKGFPAYGSAPEGWDVGDRVNVSSINDVVVSYEGSGWYSINGSRFQLVHMSEEAPPVEGFTNDVELDLGTLEEANVFVIGSTTSDNAKPTADIVSPEDAFSSEPADSEVPEATFDNLGSVVPVADGPKKDEKKEDADKAKKAKDAKAKKDDAKEAKDKAKKEEEETLGEAGKKWKIDEKKAKKAGASDADLKDFSDGEWRSYIYTLLSQNIRAEQNTKGISGNLSSGMVVNAKGIGFVSKDASSSNLAEKVKETYSEAIKKLPIEGIEDKVDGIFQDSRNWWYGQSCAAEGSNVGDSGNFNGKGVPKKALPWIDNAVKHSKEKIPAAFFAYIMDRESTFNPKAHAGDSNGGTGGLFQMNAIVWSDATDGGSWESPDIYDPMVHTQYGAKYFDDRLNTVRKMRKNNPDKPYAKDLTELEALMIAHNAGEGGLQRYPNLPAITRGYLEEFREKFKSYGGGEPGDSSGGGGGGSDSSDSGESSDSGGGGESSGKLVKPQGKHPKTSDRKSRWGKFHAGTDYGMPSGTNLPAMFDGEVTYNGWMNGYGNYLIVKGNWKGKELGYAYAHMTESKVKVGQKITAGDIIGVSGNTGIGTGPHLHLELRTADFTGPGRETNTADADKFLKSNGAEVGGGGAAPATPGESDSCPGDSEGGEEGGDGTVSNEECGRGNKIEGGLSKSGISVYRSVCAEFPKIKSYGGRRYSSIIGNKSDHYTGKAVDVMINDSGKNDAELGGNVAKFLQKNAKTLDIKYLIWDQKIWYPSRGDWRDMADRGSPTQNHKDHVHVSVNS